MAYRCEVCGYIHEGEPPEVCPQCGATDAFYDMDETELSNVLDQQPEDLEDDDDLLTAG